jgi:RNA polymerase sigma-70 factor (ECF subfamily)
MALEGECFDDLYAAHFGPLTVQVYAFVGELTEAQDLVQEAFSRAWERWDRIAGYEDPVGWVRRVAWNLAVSRWRRMRTAAMFVRREPPPSVAGPEPDRVVLVRALSRIPADQRRALVLYHMADMSVPQIADQCGVAEGTVRSWLHRGRVALAARLEPGFVSDAGAPVREEGAR